MRISEKIKDFFSFLKLSRRAQMTEKTKRTHLMKIHLYEKRHEKIKCECIKIFFTFLPNLFLFCFCIVFTISLSLSLLNKSDN